MAQDETVAKADPETHAQTPAARPSTPEARPLSPEAQRALAEAEERRRAPASSATAAKEVGGRDGPDPVRYGDWEKGGIVSDF